MDIYTVNTKTSSVPHKTAEILQAEKRYIALAARTFPPKLLIPIAPYDAEGITPVARGKAPAYYLDGRWSGLVGWNVGCDAPTLIAANAAGANAGLRTGADDGTGMCWVALDFDMTNGATPDDQQTRRAIQIRDRIVMTLEALFGPIWLRYSVGGRGCTFVKLLVRHVHRISEVIRLDHPWFEPGAVEIRGSGLQQVVAGIHNSGNPMTWARSDNPTVHYPVPTDAAFPVLEDRAALQVMVDKIMDDLATMKITAKPKLKKAGASSGPRKPEDQIAPSIEAIEELLGLMVHRADLPRDSYCNVMIAGAGMLNAMDTLGLITDDERERGVEAFVKWAASWPGRKSKTDKATERAKWDDDWSYRSGNFSGWFTLCGLAVELGVSRDLIADIDAAATFDVEPAPEMRVAA